MINATNLRPLVDHAAKQSDRWLFLAIVIGFLACLITEVVYQTKLVRELITELRADRKELSEVVRQNTAILNRVERALER